MRFSGFLAVASLLGLLGSLAPVPSVHAAPVFTDLNETTPEALVAALLAPNPGLIINTVTYTGANGASGLFTNGSSSGLGIDQGVVLTSGILSDMEDNFSSNNVAPGNVQLEPLTGAPTTNASTLTIEFTPLGSQISFAYLFASREYPQFFTSGFTDAFGFFVNNVNQALIPGTSTPVGVSTVNCGDLSGTPPVNCDLFNDNRNGDISDLDIGGFTTVFTLVANVVPNAINTLVLTIADANDGFFDSAVFLRAGSLTSCGVDGLPECGDNGGPGPGPGPVPEPGMIGLLGLALFTIAGLRRRARGH